VSELLARAAKYVAIPSVSGNERELADEIESTLRGVAGLLVTRVGDNVLARTTGARDGRILLAGHLDTVPGDASAMDLGTMALVGLGACDMKGSLAVMVELALRGDAAFDTEVTWCFFAREEISRVHSGLLEIAATDPGLLAADVAILCEPTSCVVEAGCQGTVRVEVVLRGARAHTARPWRGRNAIHRLVGPLLAVRAYVPREATIDGVTYTEQCQAVLVAGGVSANVVPDEARLTINHRVAPDRSTSEAIDALRALVAPFLEDDDEFVVVDAAEPALPQLTHPTIARLVELSGTEPRAKLGYTDVATFASFGVPAVNFGAGDPELAHHAGESVTARELSRCLEVLELLLTGARPAN
jgi:succinyl-diaminopimelate desuccinylase